MSNADRTDTKICNMALDLLHEAPLTNYLTDDTPESRWFVRNYAETRDALLEEKAWRFAIKRREITPTNFLLAGLTSISGATGVLSGAWGPFRMIEDWSGNLVRVRRSSDSTTVDAGYDTDGSGVEIDAGTISDFVGTGTGYVDRFYDQSGNGRSLVQATTSKQPVYEAEESVSGIPAASFDGSDDRLSYSSAVSNLFSTTAGYIVVAGLIDALTLDDAQANNNHVLFSEGSKIIGMYSRLGGTLYGFNGDGSGDTITDAAPLLKPFVAELRHSSGVLYTEVNGENELSATNGASTSLASGFDVGDIGTGSQALNFHLFAIATFSTIPTSAERDRLVARLMRWCSAGGAEDFGWSYRYPAPSDCLRMLPLRTDGEWEGYPIDHEIEDGDILTDQSGSIMARYIRRVTDPTRFTSQFTEALAARMAIKISHWMTGKASMTQLVTDAYNRAISMAKQVDAFEGTPERPNEDDVINARYA